MSKHCDIVVSIKDNLEDLKPCLNSVIKYTKYPYRLILIDDGSDKQTKNFLKSFVQKHKDARLITNPNNLGFVKSCNKGMKIAKGKYILLLNSDTIVTPNWLTKIVACVNSDPRIGVVSPLSNFASILSMEICPGDNIFTMAKKIERISKKIYPDIITAVGFCFMITRKALDTLGFFDEIYGMGYCEEFDYCMRAVSKGFRVVAADDTFVYHRGRASFKDYDKRYRENRKIFDSRWKGVYLKELEKFQANAPLEYLRKQLYIKSKLSIIRDIKSNIIKFLHYWDSFGLISTLKRTYNYLKRTYRYLKKRDKRKRKIKYLYSPRPIKIENHRIRVVYILSNLKVNGGIISVIQLVNELILKGVNAKIATCHRAEHMKNFKLYTQPIIFANEEEMIKNFPATDIVVATHSKTVYIVKEIVKRNSDIVPFYFIQDYESWCYPETDRQMRQRVIETYEFISHKIVKTEWLSKKLAEHGYKAYKIPPGMNLDIFYPRERKSSNKKRVLAMARPSTPYRGFNDMIKVFKLLKERRPEVEIVFFSTDDLSNYNIPFEYTYKGIVRNNDLARLYSFCDVYLDCSWFHGFGRTGAEAMACGTACVLTESGGVSEYARNNYNALLAPVNDVEKLAEAIVKLLDDSRLRSKLIQNGLRTAQQYPYQKTAEQVRKLFLNALNPKD